MCGLVGTYYIVAVIEMHAQGIRVLRSLFVLFISLQYVRSQKGSGPNLVGYQQQQQPDTRGLQLRPVQQECCLDRLEVDKQTSRSNHHRTAKSIPLDLARKLNSVESMDQFFVEFVDVDGHLSVHPTEGNRLNKSTDNGYPPIIRVGRLTNPRQNPGRDTEIEPQVSIASISEVNAKNTQRPALTTRSINGSASDHQPEKRSPTLIPKFAGCIPELRTVNLRDTDDPTLFYYPSCTRVDRCGGCCSHELLTCQPKTKQYINYTVHVSKYIGKAKLEYRGTKIVTVEKHLKCNCECKVKPGDCTSQQKYEENDCRCVCTNKEDEQRCTQEEKTKLWNPSTCQCQCREVHECSSGFYFDEVRCGCIKSQKTAIPPDYAFDQSRYQIGGYDGGSI